MKVLILAFDLGLQGGVGTFNYELVEALAEKGLEVLTVVRHDINFVNKYPNSNIKKFHSLKIPPKDVIFYIRNF